MEKSSLLSKSTLLLGGATIIGGVGYLTYKNFYKKQDNDEIVSINTVLRILKQFKRDFYPIFSNLIILSLRFQSQYRARYSNVPESFLEKIEGALTSENPIFLEQMRELEDKIYSENNITNRKQFENYCLKLAKQNAAVQALLTDIRIAYRNALRGRPEKPNFPLPGNLTPELVFNIYKNRVVNALKKILEAVDNYRKVHGTINVQDPEFNKEIGKITQGNDQSNIFEGVEMEIDEFIHPKMLFNYAVSTYDKSNPQFRQNISLLEVKENNLMQKIIMSRQAYEATLTEIESILAIGVPVEPLIKEIQPEIQIIEEEKKESQFIGTSKPDPNMLESQFEKIDEDENENSQTNDLNNEINNTNVEPNQDVKSVDNKDDNNEEKDVNEEEEEDNEEEDDKEVEDKEVGVQLENNKVVDKEDSPKSDQNNKEPTTD